MPRPASTKKPDRRHEEVHTSVLYQGSDCLGVSYVVPRNWILMQDRFTAVQVGIQKPNNPTTGSLHHGGR